jgi:molybdopterin-guanine dinucleotide biosynthesis protein A
VFVATCDSPLLVPDLAHLLREALGDAHAAVPHAGGSPQPLLALYDAAGSLPVLRGALEAGERRVLTALAMLDVAVVPEPEIRRVDPRLDSFRNANTPDALAAIERQLHVRAASRETVSRG